LGANDEFVVTGDLSTDCLWGQSMEEKIDGFYDFHNGVITTVLSLPRWRYYNRFELATMSL